MTAVVQDAVDRLTGALPWRAEAVVALAEADGRVLAASEPFCVASLEATAREVLAFFAGDWAPGDVAISNDPFTGGVVVTDFTVVRATHDGLALARVRMPDIGGFDLGGLSPESFDAWGEGARFPALRIATAHGRRSQALDLVALNSRTPRLLRRGLAAMEAATEIVAAGAGPELPALREQRRRVTEQATTALGTLRPGVYTARAAVEFPGAEPAPSVRVELALTDGAVRLDLSGSDSASPSPINSSPMHTRGCCLAALAAALPDFPAGPGALDAVLVEPGRGTVTGATLPVTTGLSPYLTARAIRRAVTTALHAAGAPSDRDPDAWWTTTGVRAFTARVDPRTFRLAAERAAELSNLETGGTPA